MTFTRTRSGLKNFRHFFGADLTLYVEGRLQTDLPIEDPTRPDAKFYNGRRQKLSATPDLSGTVLPLCLIPNSA
ncbi:hypothetical protein ACV4W4_29130, partial [Pseudomonas aeruginosa]